MSANRTDASHSTYEPVWGKGKCRVPLTPLGSRLDCLKKKGTDQHLFLLLLSLLQLDLLQILMFIFLDLSSFLLSASSRCFCSCHLPFSTSAWGRSFLANISYIVNSTSSTFCPQIGVVSFSTSSFLCFVCVPPRFSIALFLISAAWHYPTFFLSFCAVSLTTVSFSEK